MAIGDKLFIADKPTLDLVKTETDKIAALKIVMDATKTNSDTIVADTTLLKTANAVGATYGDNLGTDTADQIYTVVSLTGKYELLALQTSSVQVTFVIRIDGATNRKMLVVPAYTITNLYGLGIKCNTSMLITISGTGVCRAMYRLLP